MRHSARSFPPVTAKNPDILILGSMPGLPSLKAGQYYAHGQNAFWKIMGFLFEAPVDTYPQRLELIERNSLALWDVLKSCERTGSSDGKIHKSTEVPNDFSAFFSRHRNITRVFFNGAKAESVFQRQVAPLLPEKILARLTFERLPSTSPLHAVDWKKKAKAWRKIKQRES